MSALLDLQFKFATLTPRLIDKAHELGYQVTHGDAFRDPRAFGEPGIRVAYGNANSAHKYRLAIDLNLFKDGRFITDDEGHRDLGAWWKAQGGSWGGDFKDSAGRVTGDFNHYSLAWPGAAT